MELKKGDFLWGFVLLIWILILVIPSARLVFMSLTEAHPYIGGFVKFSILATMGDWLGVRILKNEWIIPRGFVYKATVWGIIGVMVTLLFTVFSGGASYAQSVGRLPFYGSKFAQAFFTSAIMNLTFGPMMYIYHKFGDLYIEMKYKKSGGKITVDELVAEVDWYSIVSFSWLKTCPLIWIPCHTIVFLLPSEFRVLASAFLAIVLGVLISVSKKSSEKINITDKEMFKNISKV